MTSGKIALKSGVFASIGFWLGVLRRSLARSFPDFARTTRQERMPRDQADNNQENGGTEVRENVTVGPLT